LSKQKISEKITSHRPLILVPQNKQGIYISLSHVGSHIFFHNMAANDVNNTTHIYSSESADQLNLHQKQQRIYTQRNIQTDKQKTRT
jgi:predicted GH43/DUF377 family glycosyl hydrolase